MWSPTGPGRSRGASAASSTSASGLPPVASCSQPAVSPATGWAACASSSARAGSAASPVSSSSSRPARVDPRRLAGAHGEQHRDGVGEQPPRRERQRRGRRPVEPLDVVGEHEHRPLLGQRRQQAQRGGADQLRLRPRARHEPQRALERDPLRRRQPLALVEHRPQQLVQAAERDLDLRLHPAHPQHRGGPGARRGVLEQRGLADPRLAAQDQHPALAVTSTSHQPLDALALRVTAQEHGPILSG